MTRDDIIRMAREATDHLPDADSIRLQGIVLLALDAGEQAEPVGPVAHRVVAGVLFDFMGWLTSRRERLVLSSTDDAAPAADAIKDFAEMRGLSLNDAKVQDWNATPPQRKPLTEAEIAALVRAEIEALPSYPSAVEKLPYRLARAVERAHGIKE